MSLHWSPIRITLYAEPHAGSRYKIINELQIVSVEREGQFARIIMSNGDAYTISDPPYESWENDLLKN